MGVYGPCREGGFWSGWCGATVGGRGVGDVWRLLREPYASGRLSAVEGKVRAGGLMAGGDATLDKSSGAEVGQEYR